jgi:hypothetical protein
MYDFLDKMNIDFWNFKFWKEKIPNFKMKLDTPIQARNQGDEKEEW